MIDQELFEDYKQNPTIEKRNAIVEKNLYMVDILIRKYLSKGVEYDDLYQIGALALVAAVERFDPAKGFEFSSFATPTILGEIKKYFRDKQWSLKVPRRLKEIAAKVQDAKDKLNSELHRTPTVAEIAEFTGYTEEQIIEAIESSHAYGTYSLDKTFDEAGEDGENAFLEKYTGFNEHGYDQIETAEIINKVVNTFNDQYKFIFRERFINNKSQSEIAKSLGISQMTVSRAEKNIVGKFRAELFR
ncbi:MAG: SigB/SigF/SigG family RNA polymerase sigma factor [[Eubacterium] sulci]|jgi:RNA polymerase sigma-70 factor, sigma-B/F/G subfamily|nr:RNA polymerase sigma 70 [Eubacterium sulci ATCC 35585]MBF1131406.1 SigB/SigF/SigG family RNA polymerase sigma factor [[Eubacterium] sulci]EUC77534.1 putative RNA polymerase sigma-B factor [Eubacterium sulci ATCC 35585]MBF1134852.1 SigB/SigF/SigG family RNA polymerase sigma factor [[Eubacterium] sulci]MBF1138054.1 SigB/SigF/SigG family RNA polymerase sigma factor [[Eubacterium] sulci]